MRKREDTYLSGNLVAMIDVVFQFIIFFVCTVAMQDQTLRTDIILARAPHGKAQDKKDPREVLVDVTKDGKIIVANTQLTQKQLFEIMRKVIGDSGQGVPVVIRGDLKATHNTIRKAMDVITDAGIWKIKIAALKEKGS
jgi:biopolymer transport protein ExbD